MYRFPNYPKKFIRIFSDICVYELIRLKLFKSHLEVIWYKTSFEHSIKSENAARGKR